MLLDSLLQLLHFLALLAVTVNRMRWGRRGHHLNIGLALGSPHREGEIRFPSLFVYKLIAEGEAVRERIS